MVDGHRYRTSGFTMIELVIVVVIIGIIAAIAIPKMSRGVEGAQDSALQADLTVLRNALDLYAVEHGGTYPQGSTSAEIVAKLTGYTTKDGIVKDPQSVSGIILYGPYLRKMPPLPVGKKLNPTAIELSNGTNSPGTGDAGWFYNPETGVIKANTDLKDATGKLYSEY